MGKIRNQNARIAVAVTPNEGRGKAAITIMAELELVAPVVIAFLVTALGT